MIIDFEYWSTLYEYLDKKCKLNGDIIHDAKTIQRVLNLWRNASFDYLKISNTQDLVEMWCNIEEISRMDSYINSYGGFIDYLFYAEDRMNLNRWLYLQMCINKASDLVYKEYCKNFDWNNWSKEVCGGYCDERKYFYNIEKFCEKEWESILKLIIKNQFLKEEIENEN